MSNTTQSPFIKINTKQQAAVKTQSVKTQTEFKNELLELGMLMEGKKFTYEDQHSPVIISMADTAFVLRCGTNPRIAFPKSAISDPKMVQALSNLGLTGKSSFGITLQGYDFSDKRSCQELFDVFVSIENEYRKLL